MEEFDFSQMVKETYAYSRKYGQPGEVPKGPGMVYQMISEEHIYRIQGTAVDDMRRASGLQRSEEKVDYFSTPSLDLAQTLLDLVTGKMFPKTESTLFNIGDPMENWWMMQGRGWCKIVFRNYGLEESPGSGQVLLGFLGDSNMASIRFARLQGLIQQVFPGIKVDVSEKMIALKTVGEGALLELKEMEGLFRFGKFPRALYEKTLADTSPTNFYYLNELCTIRMFWLEILARLSQELR